jgi:hypothetical protein
MSDKYPWVPRGYVLASVKDKLAGAADDARLAFIRAVQQLPQKDRVFALQQLLLDWQDIVEQT